MRRLRLAQVHVIHRHGDRTPGFNCMEPLLPDAAREVAAWAKELLTKDDMTALEMSERFPVQLDPAVTTLPRDGTLGVWGQLTKRGLRQMLALGTEMRALYIKTGFLPKEAGGALTLEGSPAPPLRDVLHCYSSHYARTQNSVQAVLCGMYPESSRAAMEKGRDAGNAVPVRVRMYCRMYWHMNRYMGPTMRERMVRSEYLRSKRKEGKKEGRKEGEKVWR